MNLGVMTMFNLVQEEEILALSSIYEDELKVDSSGKGGFFYPQVAVPDGITVSYTWEGKKEVMMLNYLPPPCLHFNFHEDYPSKRPPHYDLSCIWLTLEQLSSLCDRLEELWLENKGLVVLFQWVQFLTEDLLSFLKIESELDITPLMTDFFKTVCSKSPNVSQKENGSAVQGNSSNSSVMAALIDFNEKQEEKQFEKSLFDCGICFTEHSGSLCMKFKACGHVFCKECCKSYFNNKIDCGDVRSISCPYPSCSTELMPHHVSACLEPEDYIKYEKILMKSSLEIMHDVTYCPRKQCSFPVLKDLNSNLGSCQSCSFSFCTICFKCYHGVAPCELSKGAYKEIMEEYIRGTPSEKKVLEDRYGAKKLWSMANEYSSVTWLNENSQQCPNCRMSIQKFEGCNKVLCSSCYTIFCWLCSKILNVKDPYEHFKSGPCLNRLFEAPGFQNFDYEEQFVDGDELEFLHEDEENLFQVDDAGFLEENQLNFEEENQLGIGQENQPGMGQENQPGIGQEYQAGIGQEDHIVVDEDQSTIQEKMQEIVQEKDQATVQEKDQATVQEKDQATVQEKDQATVQEKDQAPVQEKDQATVQEKDQATVQEKDQAIVQEKDQAIVQEKDQATVQEKDQAIVQEKE